MPLVFHLVPRLTDVVLSGMPLSWLLLGSWSTPCWSLGGGTSGAERNERDFADLMERGRPVSNDIAPGIVAVCHHRHAGDRHLGTAVLAHHQRLLRRLTHGAAGLNASAIGGEYLSAACFLGVAGLVMTFGADTLWYPIGWAAAT